MEYLAALYSDLDLYADIRGSISSIGSTLRDMNALSVEEQVTTNFEELAGAVERRLHQRIGT